VFHQWVSESGGAVLLIDGVPQAMRKEVGCDSSGDIYVYPPIYTRFWPLRDEIISAADGKVENQ
jgi:hypothetical protein